VSLRFAPAASIGGGHERNKSNSFEWVKTTTKFVVQSACAVAELELAEQREFTLPPAQWQAILAALD